jgi:hypothetical protein
LCGNAALNIDDFRYKTGVFRYPLMAGLLRFDNWLISRAGMLRWLVTPMTRGTLAGARRRGRCSMRGNW